MTYNGTTTCLRSASSTGAPTGYPFTIAALVTFTATGDQAVMATGDGGTAPLSGVEFYLSTSTMAMYNNGSGVNIPGLTNVAQNARVLVVWSSLNATTHRSYAYNVDTRTQIYSDVLPTTNLGTITAPAGAVTVGCSMNGAANQEFLTGTIYWAAAYAIDMTANIAAAGQALANLGPYAVGTPSILYSFQENTGTRVAERRGTGYVGTMAGTVTWVNMGPPRPYHLW